MASHPSDTTQLSIERKRTRSTTSSPARSRSHVIASYVHCARTGDMPSPSPMTTLGARTLHTIYAGSFVVYLGNVLTDWVHAYYACRGWSVTFQLVPWLVILMVTCCCAGSVLTFLLLFLCIENAFVSKHPVSAYRGGFLMIFEKLGQWLLDFNCFRIAFLFLMLEDAPMTFINFWFISSCRVPNENLTTWPLVLSVLGTFISLLWRLLMLFYSYKHYWFFQLHKNQLEHINAESSTMEEIKSIVGLKEERLLQYDECWPVRFSVFKTYRKTATGIAGRSVSTQFRNYIPHPPTPQLTVVRIRSDSSQPEVETLASSTQHKFSITDAAAHAVKAVSCCCMCWALYLGMCASVCVPCICHYTCKRNALYHRHRFARSCTKVCSTGYNIFMLLFSLVATLTLFIVNCMWISSVQIIGHNTLPPEISQICLATNVKQKTIKPILLPLAQFSPNISTLQFDCKPVYDYRGSWPFAWNRKRPTPWKVVKIVGQTFATSWLNVDAQSESQPIVYFDFMVESRKICEKLGNSIWKISGYEIQLPWPYFRGCYQEYKVVQLNRLSCNRTEETRSMFQFFKQQ